MAVGVECLDRAGVPEQGLKGLDGLVVSDQQRGEVVPQCVEPRADGEAGRLVEGLSDSQS
jgi:hypothetical protein